MKNIKAAQAILFTPASRPEMFNKARQVCADGIILDLEDSISEADKNKARKNLVEYLTNKNQLLNIVRINHITTEHGLKDLLALSNMDLHFDFLLYPKAQSSVELNLVNKILSLSERNIGILAFIETAKGMANLTEIVKNTQFLVGLCFGAADYAAELNCEITWESMFLARSQIVQIASTRKIATFDSPCFDFEDNDLLHEETIRINKMGFDGKLAIHPKQILTIRKGFQTADTQLLEAKEIIRIYEAAKGKACKYQGVMIDLPLYNRAKQLIYSVKK